MKIKAIIIIILIFTLSFIPLISAETNLATIPYDFGDYNGNIVFSSNPQICFLDSDMLHNGHNSIRLDKHIDGYDVNFAREVNGKWYDVKSGDILKFGGYIKMNSSSLGLDSDIRYGGRISIDYYDNYGYISIKESDGKNLLRWYGYDYDGGFNQNGYVPFNSDWTYREVTVIVPPVINDEYNVNRFPNHVVLWLQVLPINDVGSGYFSDTILTITTPVNINVPTPQTTTITTNDFLSGINNIIVQTNIAYLFIVFIFGVIILVSFSLIFSKKRR